MPCPGKDGVVVGASADGAPGEGDAAGEAVLPVWGITG
jgi:hypothetical protein